MYMDDTRTVILLLLWVCVDTVGGQSSLAPPNVASVSIRARTETQLTLEWNKVKDVSYVLRYINGTEIPLTASMERTLVTHTVSSLSPGTKYIFTLYTVLKGVKSSGFQFAAVTTPPNVVSVSVKARSETIITFEWYKVGNNNAYIYILKQNGSMETYTPMYWGGAIATHTVASLSPGTKYSFTLYTLFGGERSSGYNFSAVTMPVNVRRVNVTQYEDKLMLYWEKVNGSNISYILRQNNTNETTIIGSDNGSAMTHTVTSLSPGTKYSFTLFTILEGVRSRGLYFSSVTASVTVTGLHCEHQFGSSLVLVWNAPGGVWKGVEVHVKGRSPQYSNGTRLEVHDLQPARWYNVTLKLCSGHVRSAPVSVWCQADSRGLIAGTVLAVLFIAFLICFGVFVNCRRSILKRNTQRNTPANLAPIQGLEGGVNNDPVQAKTPTSVMKKHFIKGSSKQKGVTNIQENPYENPSVN